MKPTIDELHNSGRYELINSFRIDEMGQFLAQELGLQTSAQPTKKPNNRFMTVFFLIGFLVGGGVFGYLVGGQLGKGGTGAPEVFGRAGTEFGLAFLGFFVLLPIHELIHAAVFKYYGAQKVGFGGSWKSMIVYAYAQRFVHNGRELFWVAIMPFLVISAGLIAGWLIWPQYGLFWGMTLFIHTTACVGDFVLIRYQAKHKGARFYTYDDIENEQRSYFFREKAS